MADARRLNNPVLFICDIQDKFRGPIHNFPSVIATAQKLLRVSSALKIPIINTTQQRTKLGQTCAELELGSTYKTAADVDKTAFSMWVPSVTHTLKKLPRRDINLDKDTTMRRDRFDIIIVGIETHICVLQTALDAMREGNRVWIVQDGVSSCNAEERPIALARLRQEGARVTTSESLMYEILGDAEDPAFKEIIGVVKDTKQSTRQGLGALAAL